MSLLPFHNRAIGLFADNTVRSFSMSPEDGFYKDRIIDTDVRSLHNMGSGSYVLRRSTGIIAVFDPDVEGTYIDSDIENSVSEENGDFQFPICIYDGKDLRPTVVMVRTHKIAFLTYQLYDSAYKFDSSICFSFGSRIEQFCFNDKKLFVLLDSYSLVCIDLATKTRNSIENDLLITHNLSKVTSLTCTRHALLMLSDNDIYVTYFEGCNRTIKMSFPLNVGESVKTLCSNSVNAYVLTSNKRFWLIDIYNSLNKPSPSIYLLNDRTKAVAATTSHVFAQVEDRPEPKNVQMVSFVYDECDFNGELITSAKIIPDTKIPITTQTLGTHACLITNTGSVYKAESYAEITTAFRIPHFDLNPLIV